MSTRCAGETSSLYNAAGGILWATLYGTLGYFAGRFLHDNFAQVAQIASRISWGGAIAIVVVAAIVNVRLRRARRSQAQSVAKISND
jgi:membrane protein DedA with SNARE-associated domain